MVKVEKLQVLQKRMRNMNLELKESYKFLVVELINSKEVFARVNE